MSLGGAQSRQQYVEICYFGRRGANAMEVNTRQCLNSYPGDLTTFRNITDWHMTTHPQFTVQKKTKQLCTKQNHVWTPSDVARFARIFRFYRDHLRTFTAVGRVRSHSRDSASTAQASAVTKLQFLDCITINITRHNCTTAVLNDALNTTDLWASNDWIRWQKIWVSNDWIRWQIILESNDWIRWHNLSV